MSSRLRGISLKFKQIICVDNINLTGEAYDRIALDESAAEDYRKFRGRTNVIYLAVVAGRTAESRERLSAQVVANLEGCLAGKIQNRIN